MKVWPTHAEKGGHGDTAEEPEHLRYSSAFQWARRSLQRYFCCVKGGGRGGGGGEGGSARFLMQLRKTFGARQHKRRLSMFLEPLVVRVFYKTKNLYNTYQLVLGVVPLLNGWC